MLNRVMTLAHTLPSDTVHLLHACWVGAENTRSDDVGYTLQAKNEDLSS